MKTMKKGFTLAEVLITLTILGVIAAITMPGLLNSYQKKQFVTSYKKSVSLFANAIANSIAGDGSNLVNWKGAENGKKYCTGTYCSFNAFMRGNFNVKRITAGGDVTLADNITYLGVGDGGTMGGKDLSCSNTTPCVLVVDVNGDSGPNAMTTCTAMDPTTNLCSSGLEVADRFLMILSGDTAYGMDAASVLDPTNLQSPGKAISATNFTATGFKYISTATTGSTKLAQATGATTGLTGATTVVAFDKAIAAARTALGYTPTGS